jgi:hypothetical protein
LKFSCRPRKKIIELDNFLSFGTIPIFPFARRGIRQRKPIKKIRPSLNSSGMPIERREKPEQEGGRNMFGKEG